MHFKPKSHALTPEVEVPASGAGGLIEAQGVIAGGWTSYVREGRLNDVSNAYGPAHDEVEGSRVMPKGTHPLRMECAYDGGGLARGGQGTLFIDGSLAGSGRVGAHRTDAVFRR